MDLKGFGGSAIVPPVLATATQCPGQPFFHASWHQGKELHFKPAPAFGRGAQSRIMMMGLGGKRKKKNHKKTKLKITPCFTLEIGLRLEQSSLNAAHCVGKFSVGSGFPAQHYCSSPHSQNPPENCGESNVLAGLPVVCEFFGTSLCKSC